MNILTCRTGVTSGIKDVIITCGCDTYNVCLEVKDIKATEVKEKVKVCGSTLSPTFIVGYELELQSTEPLPIFANCTGCMKVGALSIKAGNHEGGELYANYTGAMFSDMGAKPSEGLWRYMYRVSARALEMSSALPATGVTVNYDSCAYALESPCPIDSATLNIIVDGVTELSLFTNSMGELIDASGTVYGPLSGFIVPYDFFIASGIIISSGQPASFTVEVSGQCSPVTVVIGLTGGDIEFQALPSASYVVEYSNGSSFTSNTYTGTTTVNFPTAGSVVVTGCGLIGMALDGDFSSLNLGTSCLTAIDIEDTTLTEVVGGGEITDYVGNGVVIPPCDWPLISYTDHHWAGFLDLSCYTVLEDVDLSFSTVTALVGPPTVLRLDVSDNGNIFPTFDFCQFPNLKLLAADTCPNLATIDITCLTILEELYVNDSPITAITTGGPHPLIVLQMKGTANTTFHWGFSGTNFPDLEVLHWSYNGISDILRLQNHPNLVEFYCDAAGGGDPNPFIFSFSVTDLDTLRFFTYINGPVVSSDTALLLARLVSGGVNNCLVRVDTGNAPPDAAGCADIATLISNGCTVLYSAGGAC